MNSLLADYKLPSPARSKFSTQAQVEGGEAAEKLGARTDRDYAKIVKAFRDHPDAARRAYTAMADANAKNPIGYFLWHFNRIIKSL